jgi:glycosyltransferase involved in cell wall biosynthesis
VKLCIVTHKIQKGDGQGRVNYEVVLEALRRGYHLTLLASEISTELQEHHLVNWISIPVDRYPTELIRNLVFAQKSASWLRQHRQEFDVIKVNGAITQGASDVNAVHFVHSSWWQSPVHISREHKNLYGLYQWLYTAINSYWEKLAFQQTKVVIAVSGQVANELVNIGVPREKIRVIFNGVDLQEFYPGASSRQALGLPENVTLAMFAGDIRISRKNLDTVLHALVKVPDLHLAVVGDTKDSPYPSKVAELKLSDRVHFLGYRRDMPQLHQTSDFFVFPSRYEPFGLVVIEAMASGKPVITAKSTGAADLVTPACGIVLPECDDVDALANALKSLTSDRILRQQMGKAARKIAEQHSWTIMAQTYLDLFSELIKNEEHSSYSHLSPSSRFIALSESATSPN